MKPFLPITIILLMLLAACGDTGSKIALEELPPTGNPARGEELYSKQVDLAPACDSCHNIENTATPSLEGFGDIAGNRVIGQTARIYAFWSITEPGRFVVEDYGNAMYNEYDDVMSPQDIADLIAYILTL